MKKSLLCFALMLVAAWAWGQGLRPISHEYWTVTAPNEAGTSGNEGGVAFIKDDLPATFYHSNWSGFYEDGTSNVKKGADGTQAFMIELAKEYASIKQVTYAGRSDNNQSGWATKVRIYVFQELPSAWPKDDSNNLRALSTLTYTEKQALLARPADDATDIPLGTPAFDNYTTGTWPSNNNGTRTATFDTPQTGKYVLFVMDAGTDGWLTCSDFQIYQSAPQTDAGNDIAANTPYYLKITNTDFADGWYVDVKNSEGDTSGPTILKSQTPVAAYFTYNGGAWHISSDPGHLGNFLGVSQWCASPQQAAPVDWWLEPADDGSWYLRQDRYYGKDAGVVNPQKHYLGYQSGTNKLYTDKATAGTAVKIQFTELDNKTLATLKANELLGHTGVGYPAADSEARTALQAAVDATDATAESIQAAISAYQSADADVVLPEAGKVYRIYNGLASFVEIRKSLLSDNNWLKYGVYDASAQNQMWVMLSFENEQRPGAPWNAFKMMNLSTAKMPQPTGFNTNVRVSNAINDRCSWDYVGGAQFRLYANRVTASNGNADGQSLYAADVNGGMASSGNVKPYNDGTNPGEQGVWYMEEVPVTRAMLGQQISNIKNNYALSVLVKPEVREKLGEAVATAETVYNNADADDAACAEAFASFVKAVNDIDIEFVDEAYVYMKSKDRGNYAYNDGNQLKSRASAVKDYKSLFRLTKVTNGTWNIQAGNGRYAGTVSQSAIVPTGTAPTEYNIDRIADGDGYYVLRPVASGNDYNFWHEDGNNQVVGWETGAGNTRWAFEVLSEEDMAKVYTVTVNTIAAALTFNDNTYTGNQTVEVSGGFYVLDAAPAETDFTCTCDAQYTSAISVNGNNILVQEGYAYNGGTNYVLRCRSGNSYARYHSGANLDGNNMLTFQASCVKESVFTLMAGTGDYDGFYTISPIAAPGKYVYNLGTADANSKVAVREAPEDGTLTGEYYWKITERADGSSNITPYATGGTTGDTYGWNKRGSSNGYNFIGYWNGHNDASDNQWYVHTLDEEFPDVPAEGYDENDAYVGLYTYASAKALKDAHAVINDQNLAVLQNPTLDMVRPAVGKFYRLKNANTSTTHSQKYLVAPNSSAAGVALEEVPANAASSVFYLDEDNSLLSYNVGQYMGVNDKALSAVGTTPAGTFDFAYGGIAKNTVTYKNQDRWMYGVGDTNGGGVDRGTSANSDTHGYNWTLEPVNELPVVFNANALGYATFNAPVAVQIPDGVEAYVGQIVNETTVKMWKLMDGVIPANTPVMLHNAAYATEATVYLPIANEVDPLVEEDLQGKTSMVGTVATEPMSAGKACYSLQRNVSVEKVGFYCKTSGTKHGFRAWIETVSEESVAEGRHFAIIFDGDDATGIKEALGIEGADVRIYDLSGRRLDKPAQGVNIIGGKKVVVR